MSEDGLSVKERMALWKQKDAAGNKNDSPSNASKIVPGKLNIPAKVDVKASSNGTVSSPDIKLITPKVQAQSPILSLGGLPSPIQPEVPLTTPLNSPPPPPIVDSGTKEKTESSVTKSEDNGVTPERRASIKDKIAALNAGISSNTPLASKISIEEINAGGEGADINPTGAVRRSSIKDKIAALASASQFEKDNNDNNDNNSSNDGEVISPVNRKSLNIQKLGVGININALMGIPPPRSRNASEAEVQENLSNSPSMKSENTDSGIIKLTSTAETSIDNSALLTRASVPTRKKPSSKPLLLPLD